MLSCCPEQNLPEGSPVISRLKNILRPDRGSGKGNAPVERPAPRRPRRGGLPKQSFLTEEELRSGKHRRWVGGDWERKGKIQLEFMKRKGLEPHHKFLDVGCGVLRGGIHFIDYLEPGNYYGIEAQEARIAAGEWELRQARLEHKNPNLLANEAFEVELFGEAFDYALALSLFTHLNLNHIIRCLHKVGESLDDRGEFYATFFEAPGPVYLESMPLDKEGKRFTNYDSDPYHYAFCELEWAARNAGLRAEYLGAWEHPGQNMIFFARA